MIDYTVLTNIIKDNKLFLITTHVNPDADAIGSEIALYQVLKALHKKVHILNTSSTPHYLEFLDVDKIIERYDEQKHTDIFNSVDVLVALDFNSPKRMVRLEKNFQNSSKLKICIDHHQHPVDFVDHAFIDATYAATSHILFEFIMESDIVELTPDIAIPLYAAIMTDTGSFRFERTTSEIHRIIAELLDVGANPVEIYDRIYDQSNYGKVKLLGECLSNIQLNKSGEVAYIVIKQESLLRSGADESEVDGFVNYCLSIRGVKIGLLFFELKDGLKISFRSKGTIPINLLAEEFGGGGHTNAAGTRLFNVNLNGFAETVVQKAEKYLEVFTE